MKCMLILLSFVVAVIKADVYLHNPRGSNNRLNENTANRNNANRVCDTQVRIIRNNTIWIILTKKP